MALERWDGRERERFLAACASEHVMGARIATALEVLGPEGGCFFLRNGAAFYRDGDVLVAAAGPEAELPPEELPEGVREVDGPEHLCRELHRRLGGELESSYFMEYRGGPLPAEDPALTSGDPETVFAILRGSHEFYRTHLRYEPWRQDLEARVSRDLARVWQLTENGVPVGTGSLVSQDGECCVLGEIAVLPPFRGRGLGSRITRFLTAQSLRRGKTPRLMAGYDQVAGMYEALGYAPVGRWGELYL